MDCSKDTDVLWSSIGVELQATSDCPFPCKISSACDFWDAFEPAKWDRPVVLLTDDLSELLKAPTEVKDSFLSTLRGMRNTPYPTAITTVIATGTFDVLHINTTNTPPFNIIASTGHTPYFSIDETRHLFKMFQQDYDIDVESAVVDDIWAKSNGYVLV